jgi:hypothetical protein
LIDSDVKIDWSTADLAVLDIILVFDRPIDQYSNFFSAVGAVNLLFD